MARDDGIVRTTDYDGREAACLLGFIRALVPVLSCVTLCFTAPMNAHAEPLIVAHRGASADAPENTLPSFELAWKCDADAVEGDFYLTRDQEIVCIHDDTTTRVSGTDLNVANSTFHELRKLDVGAWKSQQFAGLHVPTLREVLDCVPAEKLIYIEIKCGPEIVPFLQRKLSESSLRPEQTRIISFQAAVVEAAKLALPDRAAYWVVRFRQDEKSGHWQPSKEEIVETARRIGADGIDVSGEIEVVDREFVSRCHELSLSVHVWTIDDPERARYFQQIEVDSITTNRPKELRELLFPTQAEPLQAPVVVPQSVAPTVPAVGMP